MPDNRAPASTRGGRRGRAGRASKKPSKQGSPPSVRLGHVAPNGISASMYGLVDRGVTKRPALARALRGNVEIRLKEEFAPIRITFGPEEVRVEDGTTGADYRSDLVIQGSLPDVVQLAAAPLVGGVPKLTHRRGRSAWASLAGGRVRLTGSPLLARRLLRLLEI
jgi:hypothetical protein